MRGKTWLNKRPDTVMDWLGIVFASIGFWFLLNNLGSLAGGVGTMLQILSPFAGGIVIAYILDPMVTFFQKYLLKGKRRWRWLAILLAYIAGMLILALLGWLVIPQVISSVVTLFTSIPVYMAGVQSTLVFIQEEFDVQLPHALEALNNYQELLNQAYEVIRSWAPQIMASMGGVASNFVAIFTAVAASVYMLADKDHLLHQLRTVTHACLPRRLAENVLRICHFANENFNGFFVGKIIDSGIIGVMVFISMSILRLDYAVLISVIVGITNIIPVFGPFIGAVPGVLILLFVDPIQALIFMLLILIVQQVDGNFIGPKILGHSIGISALWVLFSIVLGGDLLGVVGMVIGVPVFATLYGLAQELMHYLLERRGIDAEGNDLIDEIDPYDTE